MKEPETLRKTASHEKKRSEPQPDRNAKGRDAKASRSTGHKLAEWVSLGISAIILLALAGYLVFEAFQGNEPFVPVEVQARTGEIRQVNGRYILPVFIANRGRQTLRDLKIELSYRPADGPPESTDLTIDYVGERSEHIVYFYLDEDPAAAKPEVRAASYRLD